jgi:UDP-2,3-diacylglucosamine pyrophosphatase LpxH
MVSACTNVDTLILSDLHLGSEISRAHDALSLLESIRCKRLILLGDIFSDLNFRRLTKEHWHFLSYIRKLSNPKRKIEVIWVEGNHDHGLSNIMSHLVGIPVYQQYVWEYQGKAHLAIHGHQFDRFVVNNAFLSRINEWLFHEIQRLDFKSKKFSRYIDRLSTRWLRLSDKVAEGALSYAKQGNAARVFCGHTHIALHRENDGTEYYNSGSWVDARCTYITIGTEGVRIRDYQQQSRLEPSTDDRHSRKEREPALAQAAALTLDAGLRGNAAYESIRC